MAADKYQKDPNRGKAEVGKRMKIASEVSSNKLSKR